MSDGDIDKATVMQVAKAVFFSFIGIRKQGDLENDAVKITLLQAVIGGIVGCLIFIAGLILLVRIVTS
ncbi:DUF2970 domain-containing protein [Nitrosomonas mobilis]|uniref:Putative transmembrane protein n=1 Tax=Nitrosomonas mobilis TaxID=51642 RepID=A0A1G5SAE3_9PROT|nr:DUF2970 domain-containing protein [Nitrosomonas mobilis]SCZ84174.1 putative transmembrane protein [Nitrosomonas mobilis]